MQYNIPSGRHTRTRSGEYVVNNVACRSGHSSKQQPAVLSLRIVGFEVDGDTPCVRHTNRLAVVHREHVSLRLAVTAVSVIQHSPTHYRRTYIAPVNSVQRQAFTRTESKIGVTNAVRTTK